MISNREDPLPFKSISWWAESVEKFVIWIYMDRFPFDGTPAPPTICNQGGESTEWWLHNLSCKCFQNKTHQRSSSSINNPHENIKRLNLNLFLASELWRFESFLRNLFSGLLHLTSWVMNCPLIDTFTSIVFLTNPVEDLWLPGLIFFFFWTIMYIVIFRGSWFLLS